MSLATYLYTCHTRSILCRLAGTKIKNPAVCFNRCKVWFQSISSTHNSVSPFFLVRCFLLDFFLMRVIESYILPTIICRCQIPSWYKMNTMEYNNCEYFTVKSTRTHVYFCMKNSPPTEEEFQGTLLNVVDHYQVIWMTVYWENIVFCFHFCKYLLLCYSSKIWHDHYLKDCTYFFNNGEQETLYLL